jgi:hypothetical protein
MMNGLKELICVAIKTNTWVELIFLSLASVAKNQKNLDVHPNLDSLFKDLFPPFRLYGH